MEGRPGTIDEARKDLIKSALDASPHKIAIICTNTGGDGEDSITVAWQDKEGHIFFAENVKAPVQWGAAPEGTLKIVAEAQTVKAYPLDFSLKHGAAASAKAELFMAELKKNIMAKEPMPVQEAAQHAFEKIDPNLGVTPRDITNALMKMGLESLISGLDMDLPQAPPGGGVKADGYRFPGWKTEAGNIRDQYEKWVKDFPKAADYLQKELLGGLGEKINFKLEDIVRSDIIVTKSSALDTLNDIVEKLEAKDEDAYLALAKIIVTYVTGEELEKGNSLLLKGKIIPGILDSIWPGVPNAARENSALGLQSNRDEIEADLAAAAIATAALASVETAIANAAASEHAETTPAEQSDNDVALTDAAKSELGTSRHETGSDAQLAASFTTAHEDSFPSSIFAQPGTEPQDPAADAEDLHSEQVLIATDTESPSSDGSVSQGILIDREGASHSEQVVVPDTTTDGEHSEQVAVTSDAATDDEGASHSEQVAVASDTDEEASHSEQVAIVSDAENASINYAAVMETAKAEGGGNLSAQDQAEPHGEVVNVSAMFGQQDSLDFSMLAKQGTPAEVANQGMPAEFAKQGTPAEQLSPEAISGTPPSEAAHHPDVGSEDVGNAAPGKDPVVHHGDLAP